MIHVIASALLAALFIATGAGKVLGLGYANGMRDALRVSPAFWRFAGVLEWVGAAGLVVGIWVRPLGVAAASALVLFMLGAALSRARAAQLSGSNTGLAGGVAADLLVAVICAVVAVLGILGV